MAANVETMFYTRTAPWHGLGERVEAALCSKEALTKSGLDWNVIQRPLMTEEGLKVPGYFANVRDMDNSVLGVVTERYKIVQNMEAFAFTDELIGNAVRYETAGSLQAGKKVWLLARMAKENYMVGERITPYMVLSNSHDGSGAIKVAMTPIRVVCQNTLNLALSSADRIWTAKHTGDVQGKLLEAKETLFRAEDYMDKLGEEFKLLSKLKMSDAKVEELLQLLLPISEEATELQVRNMERLREEVAIRYYNAPDLKVLPKNGYRFINAVSDFATHGKPLRETKNYQENLFNKTMDGNALIDKAHQLVKIA